jgi:multiple sugar transport system substrate-binding protein
MSSQERGFGVNRRSLMTRTAGHGTIGVLGVALAGCGLPGQPGPTAPGSAGPVTAKVLTFNNPLFQQAKDTLLDALATEDPGLKPDIIVFPGQINQFREKAVATYAGGDIPDAQWIHPSITSLMASRKFLRPLDELSRRDKDTRLADFYQGVLDYFRWRGQAYGLPWYSPGYALVFNRSLFERLGVTPPDRLEQQKNWTWDTYVSTLRGLTRGAAGSPDRTIGMQAESANLDWFCAWLWRNGADVFSKDGKKCTLNEPAAIEVVQGVADLYLKHQVINYGPQQADFPEGFFSGRVGIRQANKEAVAPERNDLSRATFGLGMAPIYKGKAGRVNRMGTLAFGVAQDGPNGDAGWRWVRFMGGARAAGILMTRKSTLPVRSQFAKLPEFAQSTEPWESAETWLDSQATSRALQQPASYQDIADMWSRTWSDILAQKGSIRPLLDDLVRQADALLAREAP